MKHIDENTIGGRIRKARISCKLTTRELAEKVGVSQNYLSVVERNDKKQASPALLQKISEFTGVSLNWLINGESITAKAANFNDISLLLTLVMQQEPSITKETVATVLAIEVNTVDGILSGTVEYNPQWESGLSNLVQRLNLPDVRRKIRGLDALLQLEEEKKNGIELFWSLRRFFSKRFKAPFKFAGQPVRVQGNLDYTQFSLQREDESETWIIQYYPSPPDRDDFAEIFDLAESASGRSRIALAFSDADSYDKMWAYCNSVLAERDLDDDYKAAIGIPTSERPSSDIYFILVDSETAKIKLMESLD